MKAYVLVREGEPNKGSFDLDTILTEARRVPSGQNAEISTLGAGDHLAWKRGPKWELTELGKLLTGLKEL